MKKILAFILFMVMIVFTLSGCKQGHKPFDYSKIASNTIAGYIDLIEGYETETEDNIILNKHETLHVSGWAFDPINQVTVNKVAVVSNGKKIPVDMRMDISRKDVAEELNNIDLVNCGWNVEISGSLLSKGNNKLEFYALLNNDQFAPLKYLEHLSFEVNVK